MAFENDLGQSAKTASVDPTEADWGSGLRATRFQILPPRLVSETITSPEELMVETRHHLRRHALSIRSAANPCVTL
jgi:hypothetical protein